MRTAIDFETLTAIATGFSHQSKSVLADALRCLRETRDPIILLELLRELWRADPGPGPQDDIAAVGDWLVDRLRRRSSTPDNLLTELGWLYRLAVIYGKDRRAERRRAYSDRRRDRASQTPAFASQIEALRRSLQRANAGPSVDLFAPRAEVVASSSAEVAARLPNILEVCFESPTAATEAFRNARARIKDGKAPRPRLLALHPVDPALRALAGSLVCSTTATAGMQEVEQRMRDASGVAPSFWVVIAALAAHDEKRLALQVHTVMPNDEGVSS